MTKKIVLIASGGALAFALAGMASPAAAWGSVHPQHLKLFAPAGTPIIRDSNARPGLPGKLFAPDGTPVVRDATDRRGLPGRLFAPGGTPIIRDSNARPGGPGGSALSLAPPSDPAERRRAPARKEWHAGHGPHL